MHARFYFTSLLVYSHLLRLILLPIVSCCLLQQDGSYKFLWVHSLTYWMITNRKYSVHRIFGSNTDDFVFFNFSMHIHNLVKHFFCKFLHVFYFLLLIHIYILGRVIDILLIFNFWLNLNKYNPTYFQINNTCIRIERSLIAI